MPWQFISGRPCFPSLVEEQIHTLKDELLYLELHFLVKPLDLIKMDEAQDVFDVLRYKGVPILDYNPETIKELSFLLVDEQSSCVLLLGLLVSVFEEQQH